MDLFLEFMTSPFLGKAAWIWFSFLGIIIALLAFDLGVLNKTDHEIGIAESLKLSAFYISIALLYGGWVWWYMGPTPGMQYFTGFALEKALAMDNVFVIGLIFTYFAVPRLYQHRVLFWGILGVILLRGLMIGLGAAIVTEWSWVLYIFGAFLVLTGIKMLVLSGNDEMPDMAHNPLLKFMKKRMRVTDHLRGHAFFVKEPEPVTGKVVLWATPLFLCLVLVEFADIIFAVDSVPAVFAITTDPFRPSQARSRYRSRARRGRGWAAHSFPDRDLDIQDLRSTPMPAKSDRGHLNPDVAPWLDLPVRERLQRLHAAQTEWFIAYPRAVEALRRIDTIIATPPSNRPRNLLIFGEPSIGKTQIIKAALRSHPPTHDSQSRWPILFIDAPPVPTEVTLYDEILTTLNIPYRYAARTADKKNQVFSVLSELKVRIIVIDELHNLLTHQPAKQRDFLAVLKHMGNKLGISFIAAGTPDAVVALQSDKQMSSRFFFLPLPVWRFGREFRQLLAGFELLLPLAQPSFLSEMQLAARLHELSEGRLGELAILLVEATTKAIEDGHEVIDIDLLRRLSWVAPSVRLIQAERDLGMPLGMDVT